MEEKETRTLIEEVTRPLPVPLTQDEFHSRSKQLAELHNKIALTIERHKDVKTSQKKEIQSLELQRSELSQCVATEKETRDVKVGLFFDGESGLVVEIRLDTDKQVCDRVPLPHERQLALDIQRKDRVEDGEAEPASKSDTKDQ